MEMQFKNEIKKLADIVVWADNWITELKDGLTEEEFGNDKEVKEFETVKKVVLESMERHTVYTNALNEDLAHKAGKINLLEKEIEGRKEGYTALKELMDTKYISIEEHNNICEDFKKKIVKLEKESEKWQDLAKMNRDTICDQYNVCEEFKKKVVELEEKVKHQRKNLDGINKTLEIRNKENDSLVKTIQTTRREIEAHEHENKRLSERIIELNGTITELSHDIDDYKSWNASLHKDIKELKKERDKHIIDRNATIMQLEKQVKYLEKELNETCTTKELDLKGHNRREMALVNELADKNDEIKKLKESIEEWKNQERIRTNQLRATERKVEELWEEIEKFTKGEEDDHGRKGFKEYIEWLVKEEEEKFKESWKARLNEELEAIFKEEEETAVNDIPCGEDAIE